MIIGLPKEIKDNESRVGLTPAGVKTLSDAGHRVIIEVHAGEGSGISDDEYRTASGEIATLADDVWAAAEMIVKVKEPIPLNTTVFAKASCCSLICISLPPRS